MFAIDQGCSKRLQFPIENISRGIGSRQHVEFTEDPPPKQPGLPDSGEQASMPLKAKQGYLPLPAVHSMLPLCRLLSFLLMQTAAFLRGVQEGADAAFAEVLRDP